MSVSRSPCELQSPPGRAGRKQLDPAIHPLPPETSCLSSSAPSATWPCGAPQERQSILPCPHDAGLGCVTCFVQQDQWHGHQLHKYLGSRICTLVPLSLHEDPSQTAQEAETHVHLNQPRPGSHPQTSSSQLADVSMRRKCLWSRASSLGRFVMQHHWGRQLTDAHFQSVSLQLSQCHQGRAVTPPGALGSPGLPVPLDLGQLGRPPWGWNFFQPSSTVPVSKLHLCLGLRNYKSFFPFLNWTSLGPASRPLPPNQLYTNPPCLLQGFLSAFLLYCLLSLPWSPAGLEVTVRAQCH